MGEAHQVLFCNQTWRQCRPGEAEGKVSSTVIDDGSINNTPECYRMPNQIEQSIFGHTDDCLVTSVKNQVLTERKR